MKKHSSPEPYGGSLNREDIEKRNQFLQEMEVRNLKQKYLTKTLAKIRKILLHKIDFQGNYIP